mgnify:CR=1 FL=1
MNGRFYRSTREAFPVERFPAMAGPYRSNTFGRALARCFAWLAGIAFFATLIAWRM